MEPDETALEVSVVIPTLDAPPDRLRTLTRTVLESGLPPERTEVLAAAGIRPNGRARDAGALRSEGDVLVFIDDDVSFPEPGDLKKIVDYLRDHPEVGLVGPAQQLPDDLGEPLRSRAAQLPRSHVDVAEEFTETDMVTHACLALRREDFWAIGMEHPNLISGTDPDLRHRIRQRGKKVGLVPNTRVVHPPVAGWSELIRRNFRGGRRSRAVQRDYPRYHLPAEPDQTDVSTVRNSTVATRFVRHLRRFLGGVLRGHTWWLAAQLSYLAGYGYEWLIPAPRVEPIPYPDPPSPDHPEWNDFLEALRSRGIVRRLHPASP